VIRRKSRSTTAFHRVRCASDCSSTVRILFITSSYPASRSDPRGVFVQRLAAALVRQGQSVTVVAPGAAGAPRFEDFAGVQVIRQPYWIPRWQSLTCGLPGILPNLRQKPWLVTQVPPLLGALAWRAIREAPAHDVLHAHWVYPGGIAGALAGRFSGKPLVVTAHGTDINMATRSAPLGGVCRFVARHAHLCVGVSEATDEALGAVGVHRSRRAFIPLGVETIAYPDDFASAALAEFAASDAFRVVYVGSLTQNKSVTTLVEAHARLRRLGVRVTTAIVGDGPDRPRVEGAVRRSDAGSIVMAGYQPPHAVAAWLRAAHVLVLPSRSEGRPTVVLEAMAAGLPVVATDILGTRELVDHGRTGMLFPVRDADALGACLRQLADNPALRRGMGEAAQASLARQGLTTDRAAEQYRDVYRRAIDERSR
jgi:glycosyltransferase involved in cell wall biosynthesis